MSTLKGRLQDQPLPVLLVALQEDQQTGVLRIENRLGRHEVFEREGFPVAVNLPGATELIGKVLLEMRFLDETSHRRFIAELPKGTRYGEWLVRQGMVQPDQLKLALKAQVRRKLHRLFFLTDGDFQFDPGGHGEGLESGESLKVHPARSVFQGVRSAWTIDRLKAATVPLEGQALRCTLDDPGLARFGFGQEDLLVASRLREKRWLLPEILAATGTQEQPLLALVYALFICRALEVTQPAAAPPTPARSAAPPTPARSAAPPPAAPAPSAPPPARSTAPLDPAAIKQQIEAKIQVVEREDLFAVLGVARDATADQIKTAYLEAARRFHPDRLASLGLEAKRPEVEKIFRRVSEAYNTLYDDERRAAYLKKSTQPEEDPAAQARAMQLFAADLALQRGEAYFKKNEFGAALREFEAAVKSNPEDGEMLAYHTFTRVCLRQVPYAEARERLTEALNLSPRCGRAHYFMGVCHKEEGDVDHALASFKKACELDPRLVEAEREIRVIAMRKDKEKGKESGAGGFLSRFRKK